MKRLFIKVWAKWRESKKRWWLYPLGWAVVGSFKGPGRSSGESWSCGLGQGCAMSSRGRDCQPMAQLGVTLLSSCPDLLAGTFQWLKPTRSKRARELGCCYSQRSASQGTAGWWRVENRSGSAESINISHSRERVKCFQCKRWFFHGPDISL